MLSLQIFVGCMSFALLIATVAASISKILKA